jgi:hypothetical protein
LNQKNEKLKKFGIVCTDESKFKELKNRYEKTWHMQYEFIWIKPTELTTGLDITAMYFDESHEII